MAETVSYKCPSLRACIVRSGISVPGAERNDVQVRFIALLGLLLFLGYQFADICPSHARHEACYDRIASDVLVILGSIC